MENILAVFLIGMLIGGLIIAGQTVIVLKCYQAIKPSNPPESEE